MKSNKSLKNVIALTAGFCLLAITSAFAANNAPVDDSLLAPGAGDIAGICDQVCDGTGKGKIANCQIKGQGQGKQRGKGGNCDNLGQGRRANRGNGACDGTAQGRALRKGQGSGECILNNPAADTTGA